MPGGIDEQIGQALAAAHNQIADQARREAAESLRALADAFGHGRWGSFWVRFSEPTLALRRLCDLTAAAIPHLLPLPHATRLVGRLVEVVVEMASVVVAGERASWEKQAYELRELLQVKDDFLSLTVHELRAPVGQITGYLSMIQDGDFGELPDRMRQTVNQTMAAAQQFGIFLDGLARVAQLEDQAGLLQNSPCNVEELVGAALKTTEPLAKAKNVRIEHRGEGSRLVLVGDAGMLTTAIANLVGNAIKHSPDHSTVAVGAESRPGDAIAITVRDQGPGIAPLDRERIFDKHYRADANVPGLGLGLYLVRRIAQLHGGSVTLDSQPGLGSAFTLNLATMPSHRLPDD
jgi:two-component system, OmpR family, phosphate regulon sensor histidine kinase PhoR